MQDFRTIQDLERRFFDFDGGFKIEWIKSMSNEDMSYAINLTMMRIDLKNTLKPGASISFKIKWWEE